MRILSIAFLIGTAFPVTAQLKDAPAPPAGFPKFKVQEIAADLKIGYAVATCDVNGDGKPDIVVVDKERVIWYENPTWQVRPIITGKTKPDNVCIASLDIDGDGKVDFVLGAGWRPADTKNPGTLQWLNRGKTLDEEWTVHPIPCDEPTVHRVKVADLDGDNKPEIIMAPLQGRDCTAKGNWVDGRPVRIMAYKVPKDPMSAAEWNPILLNNELHVVHNVDISSEMISGKQQVGGMLIASFEGIRYQSLRLSIAQRAGEEPIEIGAFSKNRLLVYGNGDQRNTAGNRGSSEVSFAVGCVAAIEPWHGNQVVAYTYGRLGQEPLDRHVIDDHLRWGHAVKGHKMIDPTDFFEKSMIVVGVRDNPDPKAGDTFTEKRGVRLYRNANDMGTTWDRYILEDGGVAVEDLTVADLNGDGKPDIVAVGRQTFNCRIYWNQGK